MMVVLHCRSVLGVVRGDVKVCQLRKELQEKYTVRDQFASSVFHSIYSSLCIGMVGLLLNIHLMQT